MLKPKGDSMFLEYIQQLRASGRRHFTSEEIRAELQLSDSSVRSGLYRLKRDKKVISPFNGLYVIVPPENHAYSWKLLQYASYLHLDFI